MGTCAATLFVSEDIETVVVIVALTGHARFVAPERLATTSLLGHHHAALAIPPTLHNEGVRELGREIVDGERGRVSVLQEGTVA